LNDKNGHHIIPKHAGGPDNSWNIVMLTTEDHKKTHELRFEVYQEKGDSDAVRFWKNPPQNNIEAQKLRAQLSRETCKAKGVGFFSSEQQSINGKKGGKTKSDKKEASYVQKLTPAVVDRLSKPMLWKHRKNAEIGIIQIEAGSVKKIADFRLIFANALPEGEEKAKLLNMSTVNFTSAVSKVLKGQRQTAHNFTLLNS